MIYNQIDNLNQFIIFLIVRMYQQKESMMTDEKISEKLQIYISARNLVGPEGLSSYVEVYLEQPNLKKKMILKTKARLNDLNPNFDETIVIQFIFQVKQKLTFEVYHLEKKPKLIGQIQTSVGEIFGSPANGFIKPIKIDGQQTGKIILRCQKIEKGKRKTFTGQLSAQDLPNLTWWYFFGGTCPFFRIFRKRRQGDELLLYESEVINYTINPNWRAFKLSEQKLCGLNEETQLQIRVYNFLTNGKHTLIGVSFFSLKKLEGNKNFPILLNNKDKRGQIIFKKCIRNVKHEFGQYIQRGLQLSLVSCIDFTASNGNPENKQSLHFSTLTKKSQYQEAMTQVLDILLDYDYDKLVPCFGFGAQVKHPKFNTGNSVHHCFPLNGNQENPNIYQKQNILKAYRTIINNVKFSGPTLFSQLLKNAMKICRQFETNPQKSQYMILFILTDGQIHDKLEVIDLLIACSRLPLSVIIVGIGKSDFALMKELDDDDCQLVDSKGQRTERDLVQFVEFSKFKNNGVLLAKQVLQQLPRQVQEYYQLMGVAPQSIKRRKSDIEEQMWLRNSD